MKKKTTRVIGLLFAITAILLGGYFFLIYKPASEKEDQYDKAFNAALERGRRVTCSARLRQIGESIMLYNKDHKAYPSNLGLLVTQCDLSPNTLICASNEKWKTPWLDLQQKTFWVNSTDFVYLGADMKANTDRDAVLAHEKPNNHDGQGVNVLFYDGHVEWFTLSGFEKVMQKAPLIKGK